MKLKFVFTFVFFLCVMPFLCAITIEEKDSTWRFFILKPSPNLDNPSFPGLFAQLDEALLDIQDHTTTNDELRALQHQVKKRALDDQRNAILAIRKKLDDLLFNDASKFENWQAGRRLQRELKKAQLLYETLREFDAQTVSVLPERPIERVDTLDTVEFIDSGQMAFSMELLAAEHDLRQVFYSIVENIDDYRVISMWMYNDVTTMHTQLAEEVILSQEVTGLADRIILPIVEALAGQQMSELHIHSYAADGSIENNAEIRINDTIKGFGEFHSRFFPSGSYTVAVRFPNRQIDTKEIILVSKEDRTMYFYTHSQLKDTVRLVSIPPGATVFRDSLYLGLTPLKVQRPLFSQHVLLQSDSYYDAWTILGPESSDIVSIALLGKDTDTQSELQRKRNHFYTSIAILAASIPFPIVFSMLYQERGSYLQSPSLTAAARAENQQLHDIYRYTFWASLGVTLSATGYMAFRLGQYLHYANTLSEDWTQKR